MEYEKAFSERLAKLRINAGMSARDLSLSMGQSSGYINKIERAQNMPSMTGFFYMCEILKITPKDFFDDAVQDPYRVNAITEKLKLMSDKLLLKQLWKKVERLLFFRSPTAEAKVAICYISPK